MIEMKLDYKGPIPLYHQIAEAIRFRIASGLIRGGVLLPPLKTAAKSWSVNIHTVRRAYQELEKLGLVETKIPRGTAVLADSTVDSSGASRRGELPALLRHFITETAQRFNMEPAELARILSRETAGFHKTQKLVVYVTECSETQSADLAQQIMEQWDVKAAPWSVSRKSPPSESAIISTYFHFNDIRRRWPQATNRMHFLPVGIVDDFWKKINATIHGHPKIKKIVVCEREETMLQNVAIDVTSLITDIEFPIERVLIKGNMFTWLDGKAGHTLALLSPRLWGELPKKYQERPDIIHIRYRFNSQALEFLGNKFGWRKQ